MTKKQSQSFLKRLSAIAGAVGLGTLAVSPALAQTNPNPSIFSEPPYNRAGNNAGTMMPGDPASEAAPAAEMAPSYSKPAEDSYSESMAAPETMPADDSMMEAPEDSTIEALAVGSAGSSLEVGAIPSSVMGSAGASVESPGISIMESSAGMVSGAAIGSE